MPMSKTATRCILSVWLFGGLIITTVIGGDMTASMTIAPPHFKVDSLDNILEAPALRADVMAFSSHMNFIESNYPLLAAKIESEKSAIPGMKGLMTRDKFMDIASQKAVQINDRYTLLSGIEKHCNFSKTAPLKGFYFAKNLISAIPVSMFFNKRLSRTFMERINVRMLRVLQSGVTTHWLQSVMDISPYCFSQPHSGEYAPLEIDHIWPAFKLWAKGLLAASICFSLEAFAFLLRAAYLCMRDGNFSCGRFLRNVWKKREFSLSRFFRSRKTIETFVTKQHRKKAATFSGSTFSGSTFSGSTFSGSPRVKSLAKNEPKVVRPSDFRRLLWKDMSLDAGVANRVRESVVNRESQASGDGEDSVASNSINRGSFVKPDRFRAPSKDKPVVRYVDSDSFFSKF